MRKQKLKVAATCVLVSMCMATSTYAAETSETQSATKAIGNVLSETKASANQRTENTTAEGSGNNTSSSSSASIDNMKNLANLAATIDTSLKTNDEANELSDFNTTLAGSTDSWLANTLNQFSEYGIDTSGFVVSGTSAAQNLITTKYSSLQNDMTEMGYGEKYELQTYTPSKEATTAEQLFQSTYGSVYENMKGEGGKLNQSLDDYKQEGVIIPTFSADQIASFDAQHTIESSIDTSDIEKEINSTKDKLANTDTSAGSLAVSEMIDTFKEQLNSAYSDYMTSSSYKAVKDAISTYNVADMIANRTRLPDTISTAVLMSSLSSVTAPITAQAAAKKAENFAQVATDATNYKANVAANSAAGMNQAAAWYSAACNQAKVDSGYNEVMSQITQADTSHGNMQVTFSSASDAIAYCNEKGMSVDSMGINDDGEQVVNLENGTLFLSIDEAKADADLIASHNGTASYRSYEIGGKTSEQILEEKKKEIEEKNKAEKSEEENATSDNEKRDENYLIEHPEVYQDLW